MHCYAVDVGGTQDIADGDAARAPLELRALPTQHVESHHAQMRRRGLFGTDSFATFMHRWAVRIDISDSASIHL